MSAKIDRQPCPIEDCPNLQQHATYPWCGKHLARYRRHGDPLRVKAPRARLSPDGTKRECSRCEEWKLLHEFYPEYEPGKGKRSACKACIQAEAREKWATDPARQQKADRRQRLKKYGITDAAYDAMVSDQRGTCAICGEKCSTGRRLAVDHDHDTGDVRGLLCGRCNLALGHIEERGLEWIPKAIKYLRASSAQSVGPNRLIGATS